MTLHVFMPVAVFAPSVHVSVSGGGCSGWEWVYFSVFHFVSVVLFVCFLACFWL